MNEVRHEPANAVQNLQAPREVRQELAVWPHSAVALVAQAAGELVELGGLRVVRERELLVLPFWATDGLLERAVVARE